MSETRDKWFDATLPDLIRTTANCGRLTERACKLAARPGGPEGWFERWIDVSEAYRSTRRLAMWGRRHEVAQLARRLGICCDADRVIDAPFTVAIEIDRALCAYPFNLDMRATGN